MKLLYIYSIVCFLFAAQGLGGESRPPLETQGLKANYVINNPVAFDLINSTGKAVFYGVGVEQRVEPGWREIVPNIEDIVTHQRTSTVGSLSMALNIWCGTQEHPSQAFQSLVALTVLF